MRKIAHIGQLSNGWNKTLDTAGKDERESIYERNVLGKRSSDFSSDVEMKVMTTERREMNYFTSHCNVKLQLSWAESSPCINERRSGERELP